MEDQHPQTGTRDQYIIEEVTPEEDGGWTTSPEEAVEEAQPYLAPTDPPVLPSGNQGADVAAGFGTSPEDVPFRADAPPGDGWLEEEIRRVLREDSITESLPLDVRVENGVATLSGAVTDVEDAEQAEAVAAAVPGVASVVDRTEVRPDVVEHISPNFRNADSEP